MRRREFMAAFGIAAAWPLASRAQQRSGKTWRVGYLNPGSSDFHASNFNAWKRRMGELGYLEGQNLIIDVRFAEFDLTRLPRLARDLVAVHPDALVAVASPAVSALKSETSTIPIVMADIGDPIGSGFVKSLARPGGRITGTANMTTDYIPKTIELLRELLPGARRVAALMSANPTHQVLYRSVEIAAKAAGIDLFRRLPEPRLISMRFLRRSETRNARP
jgi:putative ABC transport system substrate-binding protein